MTIVKYLCLIAAALAILSNNGIAGSDAGTSLKTMLMRLAAPTGEAATAMQQLGLNVYDSTGAIVPFGDMLGQLESSLQGLTDEQRNAALTTIFGADAIRAATILAGEGAAGFAAMQEAVTEEGSAAALAQANMSGLSGAIQYFKGSIDSLLIKTATPYLEMLSQMIRGTADLFTRFSSLPRSVQRFAAVLTGVLAVGGPLLIILGTMATGLALLLTPVGLVIAALLLLGAVAAANWERFSSSFNAAKDIVTPALRDIRGLIDDIRNGDVTFREVGTNLMDELKELPAKIQAWAGGVDWGGLVARAGDVAGQWRAQIESWVADALARVEWAQAVETAGAWATNLRSAVWGAMEGIQWDAASDAVTGLRTKVQEWVAAAVAGVDFSGATAAATTLTERVRAVVDGAAVAISSIDVGEVVEEARQSATDVATAIMTWRDNLVAAVVQGIEGIQWEQGSLRFASLVQTIAETIRTLDLTSIPWLSIFSFLIASPVSKAIAGLQFALGEENFRNLKNAVLEGIGSIQWREVLGAFGNLVGASGEQLVNVANDVVDEMIAAVEGVDWSARSISFANLATKVAEEIDAIDWTQAGNSVGEAIRTLLAGDEEGQGGLFNLAGALYDALTEIDWLAVFRAKQMLQVSIANAVGEMLQGAINGLYGSSLQEDGTWSTPEWVTSIQETVDELIAASPQWVLDVMDWIISLGSTPLWVLAIVEWWNNVTTEPGWVKSLGEWWLDVTTEPGWVKSLLDFIDDLWIVPPWVTDLVSLVGKLFGAGGASAAGPQDWGDGIGGSTGDFNGGGDRSSGDRRSPNNPGFGTRGVGMVTPFDFGGAVAAAAGQPATINVTVNQALDWEEVRWRLQDLARRRG